jgi:hypothetical protein
LNFLKTKLIGIDKNCFGCESIFPHATYSALNWLLNAVQRLTITGWANKDCSRSNKIRLNVTKEMRRRRPQFHDGEKWTSH